jgi:3-oxoacyl-[acyl-carrier protein] reductase
LRRNARPGNFTGHMDLGFNGKLALITASSGGIGFEIARALAREGAHVIINGRNQSSVDVAIQTIKARQPDAVLHVLVADNGATLRACRNHN